MLLESRDRNFFKSNFGMCFFWIPETDIFPPRVRNLFSELCFECSKTCNNQGLGGKHNTLFRYALCP